MKQIVTLLLALLCLVTQTGTVLATASTHVWAPSTDIQPFKLYHITYDLYLPVERDDAGSRWPTVTNIGLTAGILPGTKVNMEIGFDHKSGLGALDDYPIYLNAKIGTPEKSLGTWSPALAVGIFDVGLKSDLTNYNVIYAKAAWTLMIDSLSLGRFSAGYFSGNDTLLRDDKGEKDNTGVLIAWERTMSEISDKLWLCVDYMGSKSAYGSINVGASWKFASNVALIVGYDIYNNDAIPATSTLQVDIDF